MKLTVTIPTYNRPKQIQNQVRDIIKQLTNDVELIVYDNYSDIPVRDLFTGEELSHLTIIRNEVNIGGDANQARCLENVKKGWVWTLSDDDKINDDAISIIFSLIENHSECCYINTGNKKTKEITSLNELLDYFKIIGSFGISFFQSANLFNMDKMHLSVFWFYNFLSSQIGQICMVIKYFELSSDPLCFFTTQSLICNVSPGGWSPLKLITNSSIIIDKFHYCPKLMRCTLFKALGDLYLDFLGKAKISFKERLYYLSYISFKLGFFNIIILNRYKVIEYILIRLLPQKLFYSVRSFVADKYNNNLI
jgi:glycosyltransferase involved in cell wall biosynthesis